MYYQFTLLIILINDYILQGIYIFVNAVTHLLQI